MSAGPRPISHNRSRLRKSGPLAAALALALLTGGCFATSYQRGYVLDQAALDQVPVGASQEQVILVLGSPSTIATVSGEVFYYISQKTERKVAFMNPDIVDQRVLAIYFGEDRRVRQIANYGIQDGKVFDFVSRTTPTGGQDLSLVRQILGGLLGVGKQN
jgi:outer membrane protein assembly factor BamE (lipoprotein component of BamABCDE complex)